MKQFARSARVHLLISLFVIASAFSTGYINATPEQISYKQTENVVYICSSPKAYAYHKSKSCRGLNRCSYEVKSIPKSEATSKYKRSACKVCY